MIRTRVGIVVALGVAAFGVVVKYFAVLPASIEEWNYMFRLAGRRPPAEP